MKFLLFLSIIVLCVNANLGSLGEIASAPPPIDFEQDFQEAVGELHAAFFPSSLNLSDPHQAQLLRARIQSVRSLAFSTGYRPHHVDPELTSNELTKEQSPSFMGITPGITLDRETEQSEAFFVNTKQLDRLTLGFQELKDEIARMTNKIDAHKAQEKIDMEQLREKDLIATRDAIEHPLGFVPVPGAHFIRRNLLYRVPDDIDSSWDRLQTVAHQAIFQQLDLIGEWSTMIAKLHREFGNVRNNTQDLIATVKHFNRDAEAMNNAFWYTVETRPLVYPPPRPKELCEYRYTRCLEKT